MIEKQKMNLILCPFPLSRPKTATSHYSNEWMRIVAGAGAFFYS